MIKYMVKALLPTAEIIEIDVIRETDKYIFIHTSKTSKRPNGERKELKHGKWEEYYDSWEDAHSALMLKADKRIASARLELDLANSFAENVKGMRHN